MISSVCKRNIVIFALIAVLLLVVSTSMAFVCDIAFADGDFTPVITVQSKTVHRGQAFEINVDLSGNEGLTALELILDYDQEVMRLTNIRQGDGLSDMTFTTTNLEGEWGYDVKNPRLLWDNTYRDTTNGTIVTFTFESFSTAPVGDYPISVSYVPDNTNYDMNKPIAVSITNGVVTLIKGQFSSIYRDWDGTVLFEKDYNSEEVPEYVGEQPSRADTAEYSYEFKDWTAALSDDPNLIIYDAHYTKTAKVYSVFYYIDGVKGEPDGSIDETADFYTANQVAYGTFVDVVTAPIKQDYEFIGWYLDNSFSTPYGYATMPASNLRLYGYYKFDIRDGSIPKINLKTTYVGADQAIVKASIVKNTGLNALVLTIDYDRTALRLSGFDKVSDAFGQMRFDNTNIEKISEEGFKFYYDYSENNYDTGDFLILYFDLIDGVQDGIYNVTFTYDYHRDATYINAKKEIKYTKLEIVGAEVPIGTINHWNQPVDKERVVDVTSDNGKPINVRLSVELVTESVDIESERVTEEVGDNMMLSSAYTVKLLQNGDEIEPDTTLTIRIKLTENEKKSKNLKFYTMNSAGEMVETPYQIEDGYLVFSTDTLNTWLLFYELAKFNNPGRVVTLIGMPILLSVVTMLYVVVMMTRKKQKMKYSKGDAQ